MYIQRLAEEGMQNRLEQVFLELLGPVYPIGSEAPKDEVHLLAINQKDGKWETTIAGLDKRKLLREVLEITGRFRELQAMNVQYDTALKDLEEHDAMIID